VGLPSSIDPSEVARLTRAQYDAIVASGALEGARVELLEGVIVEMSPQGVAHAGAIEILAQLLRDALGPRARVREEKPFAAGDDAEPEPDIAVVAPGDPFAGHPDRAFLIVEVAETSLKKDRGVKTAMYARANVAEYWVVNLQDRLVEVHLDPNAGRYTRTSIARRGDSIALSCFPDVRLDVDRFLR
jgi:Uma2 family endonuclease